MTNQQVLEQIIQLPIEERIESIEKVSRSVRADLSKMESGKTTPPERSAAINRLRGIAQTPNPPMTREEERKMIEVELMKKYS
jgi:hypothetical protein